MKRIITSLFLAALVATLSAHMSLSAQNKQLVELKTVVIDAGHGGHDPGATNGKIYEKNITLSVAKRLGELIRKNYPSINVIYTRSDDRFVELYKRADIANKNNADLFISIHVNSAGDRSARGHETFVMGQDKNSENFEICRTENSVIVLEDDYSSNYQGFDPGNPESYIIFSLLQSCRTPIWNRAPISRRWYSNTPMPVPYPTTAESNRPISSFSGNAPCRPY